ncbi:MAG: low molecular weight protein-tyrosine-phosphatase [Myxococcota bacterium]
MIRICFVCLGNICRSPTAEGAMRKLLVDSALANRIEVDSAGTAAYHAGEPADERSSATALERGVRLTSIARQFTTADFDSFDYVIAMDRENLQTLRTHAPGPDSAAKVTLLRSYDPDRGDEDDVPDPYYGGPRGFDRVFEICESGCAGLLAHIRAEHGL